MIEFKDYDVKIFTDNIEQSALDQIRRMLSYGLFTDVPVRIMPDVHAGTGSVIGFTAPVKDKVVPNIVGVDINCLDKDTEVLTSNGWVKISEYKTGEKIMHFKPETDEGLFLEPLAYVKAPCKNFHWFHNSKGMDQMVSDEHNLLVYQGFKGKGYSYKKMTASELEKFNLDNGYYGFKTCFNISNNPGLNISDDLIRVDIMIQADGCIKFVAKDHNRIELHFRKERKIKRAKQLLSNAKIDYKSCISKDGTTTIYFSIDKSFNKDLRKYYLATKEQLEVVCDECIYWDGHDGYRSYYSNVNKSNVDVIQFAFTATNIRAGIYTKTFENEKLSDSYVVIPTKNPIVGYNKKSEIVDSVDGYKYCFMTETGYFVCRRNEKIFITGNCGMHIYPFKPTDKAINFHELNEFILHNIPSGNAVRVDGKFKALSKEFIDEYYNPSKEYVKQLLCNRELKDQKRLYKAIGSLGGGEAK